MAQGFLVTWLAAGFGSNDGLPDVWQNRYTGNRDHLLKNKHAAVHIRISLPLIHKPSGSSTRSHAGSQVPGDIKHVHIKSPRTLHTLTGPPQQTVQVHSRYTNWKPKRKGNINIS
ncbi:hypothetical protein BS78_03G287400 [Paspalum vaginatum]|nr:hypothetical protein BS78_03G287400 [Paspalum vaginatum]